MGVQERREREREVRRGDILNAAKTAFERYGIEHCSMERIAEVAELSKGTLYLYYRNRDELILELLTTEQEDVVMQIEKLCAGKQKPDVKLLQTVDRFETFAKNHRFYYKMFTHLNMRAIINCSRQEDVRAFEKFQELNLRIVKALTHVVQEGIDMGLFFTNQPAEQVVYQMIITIKGVMVVLQNSLLPPQWENVGGKNLLKDTARLMIRGLQCKPQSQGQFS
ncbi:MAG: TetR/AcrR family transcriptional regulator [Bradyrhizobiaceae bacterium]|nr:TetR/AcrR family transcriptional regulator [Bradyrhizobiaceae bacterium]